jgi:hypothetical protein
MEKSMSRACCARPAAKVISIGGANVSLVGVEHACRNVYVSGVEDEEEIQHDLLAWIRDFGNVVVSGKEREYMCALMQQYRAYVAAVEREARVEARRSRTPQQKGDRT